MIIGPRSVGQKAGAEYHNSILAVLQVATMGEDALVRLYNLHVDLADRAVGQHHLLLIPRTARRLFLVHNQRGLDERR